MKTMGPNQKEIYNFLEVEQTDGIKTKEEYKRVKEEVTKRTGILAKTELSDKNLIKAFNIKVIPVTEYAKNENVCKFTQAELAELNQVIKRQLRKMVGRQLNDEILHMKRTVCV